jgi:hypothetical protein
VWIVLFLYVRSLARHNRDLERELADLRALLERKREGISKIDEPR